MTVTAEVFFGGAQIADFSGKITGLTVIIGLLIGILLLPSLKKIKVGNIELDTISFETKTVHIDPLLARMELVIPLAPLKQPLESFKRPLQSFHMPLKYSLRVVPMPKKPVGAHNRPGWRMPIIVLMHAHEWFMDFDFLALRQDIKMTRMRNR
jgi:hypothetical protein